MQVVEQVTRAVRVQQTSQGTEIRIRLVPENLGEVHVKITMEKGVLTAEFRASTEATREILAKQAQQIQTVLEGSGMQAERVIVRTANAGTEDRGGNPLSQRESTPQQSKEQGPGHDQRGRGQQSQSGDDREGKGRSPWDRWERFA
jgi:flagellar hook-length control protein FliK